MFIADAEIQIRFDDVNISGVHVERDLLGLAIQGKLIARNSDLLKRLTVELGIDLDRA